ncbi:galanin receptor 2a-like [Patiria miniata]|uniref:G-protein coupled receptors family 1 profile domain-containing protein n=1 Tax=Patiria miniata TaxID=46514 RepID=A0A913YWE7_PATMI|nr:galanin receptor 2a-like [Patiria miniata]
MDLEINCSHPSYAERVIHPVGAESVHLTFAIIGLVGNGLVFIVFIRIPRLRMKTTNIFLFNLAIADFCSSVFMASRPYVFKLDPESLAWKEFVCRFFKSDFPLWTCVTASIYNLLLVTVDRYLCVVKPFLYRRYFTVTRIRLMVMLCWLFSAILETYCFYSTRVNDCGSCELYWPSQALQIVCTIATFLLTYLLPTLVMLFAYGNIVKTLKKREEALQNHHQPVAAGNLLRARRNIVRMLQVLVLLFGVLWAPNQLLFLYLSFPGTSVNLTQLGFSIILAVGFINCVVNPIVYSFKNPQFKKALLTVICCRLGPSIAPSELNVSDLILDGGGSRSAPSIKPSTGMVQIQPSHHEERDNIQDQIEPKTQPRNTDQTSDILQE